MRNDWLSQLTELIYGFHWMNEWILPSTFVGGDMKLWCCWSNDVLQASVLDFWITYSTLFFFSILILILIFSLLSLQAFDLKRISDIYFVFSFFLSFDFRILFILFYLNWIFFFLSAFSWTRTMMMVMLRWWTHSSCEWDVVDGLIDWWQNEWCFEFVLWLWLCG